MSQKTAPGRKCYNHLGGKLGAALLELYLSNGWIVGSAEEKGIAYHLTEEGAAAFSRMGLRIDEKEL